MIKISLNNEVKMLAKEINIEQLLFDYGFQKDRVAVAVNTEFVSRSNYTTLLIKNNDKVDVLAPVQGG